MTPMVDRAKENFLPLSKLINKRFNYTHKFMDNEGVSRKVCRDFVTNVLQVPPSRLYKAVQSSGQNPSARENRGRAVSKNKTSEEAKVGVKNFINLFPKYRSHYGRSKSQKKYLNPQLNLKIMYEMYKDSCAVKEIEPVSNYIFRHIFNTEFNLSFKRRHKDTCKNCDKFAATLKTVNLSGEVLQKVRRGQHEHHKLCERVKEEWTRDVEQAREDDTIAVLTFDLQKALATPTLTTNVAYYKRQLWTYNLCVYDEVTTKGIPTCFFQNLIHSTRRKLIEIFRVQCLYVSNIYELDTIFY